MAHKTLLHTQTQHGSLLVIDNFYIRHPPARQLHQLTDLKCRVLGTLRVSNVDAINHLRLKEAIEALKHEAHDEWGSVQVHEKHPPGTNVPVVAKCAGFVMLKDISVVTFYTNDMKSTPICPIYGPDTHAFY